jgi:hypothetical protein
MRPLAYLLSHACQGAEWWGRIEYTVPIWSAVNNVHLVDLAAVFADFQYSFLQETDGLTVITLRF